MRASLAARLSVALGKAVTLTGQDVDPATVAVATRFGGGPGPASFLATHARLTSRWQRWVRQVASATRRHQAARARLAGAVAELVETGGDTR